MATAATPTTTTALSPIVEEVARGPTAPPLAVRVQVRFADPLVRGAVHPYTRDYASSDAFRPTKRLCKGLLRRIEHCSEELITRRDPTALLHRLPGQAPREPRYELAFAILRPGEVLAQRKFCCYQRQALTQECAGEVLLATHRMIGLFLRQHDKGFRWTNEPVGDHRYINRAISSSLLSIGDPMPLGCVPPSRFLEASQSFQFSPGYSIEFSFKSSSNLRKQHEWTRTLSIQSRQDAPLNLAYSENLLWAAAEVVNTALGAKKRELDYEHHSCEWLEGPVECKHFEENALEIEIRIENSLGPVYEHLNRRISTKLAMFRDADGEDCYYFLRDVQAGLVRLRNKADEQVSATNDFELRVLELRGRGWRAEHPAKFTLDSAVTYSQRSIEAILERVQSGIADVLRGDDAAVHITAYKRGHLILDKALVARDDGRRPKTPVTAQDVEAEKKAMVSRLEGRIQQDLDRILKDTCSLDDISDSDSDEERNSIAQIWQTQPTKVGASPSEHVPLKQALAQPVAPAPPLSEGASADVAHKPAKLSAVEAARPKTPVAQTPSSPITNTEDSFYTPVKSGPRIFPLVPIKYTLGSPRVSDASTLTNNSADEMTTPSKAEVAMAPQKKPVVAEMVALSEVDSSCVPTVMAVSEVELKSAFNGGSELAELDENAAKGSFLSSDPADSVAGDADDLRSGDEAEPVSSQSTRPSTADGEAPATGMSKAKEQEQEQAQQDSDATDFILSDAQRHMYSSFYSESVPSTPGLSHGDEASPRHSLLITPTFLRTLSGSARPIIMGDMEKDDADAAYSNPDYDGLMESPTADRLAVSKSNLQAELQAAGPLRQNHDNVFSQSKATFDFDDMDGASSLAASSILSQIDEVPTEEEEEEEEEDEEEEEEKEHGGDGSSQIAAEETKALDPAVPESEITTTVVTEGVLPREGAQAASVVAAPAADVPVCAAENEDDLDETASVSSDDSASTTVGGAEVWPATPVSEKLDEPLTPSPAAVALPSPAIAPLESTNTDSWEDCPSVRGRDSVDTFRTETGDEVAAEPTTPVPRRKSISTTTYLGLHQESRGLGFGLRDALVGPHHWVDDDDGSNDKGGSAPGWLTAAAAVADVTTAVGKAPVPRIPTSPRQSKGLKTPRPHVVHRRTTSAIGGSGSKPSLLKRLPKSARRRTKSSSAAAAVLEGRGQHSDEHDAISTDQDDDGHSDDDEGRVMLPRFMMLFASMAVASQVLQHR